MYRKNWDVAAEVENGLDSWENENNKLEFSSGISQHHSYKFWFENKKYI